MTPSERANQAQLILDNETFHEAFQAVERGLVDLWKASAPDAWKQRERVYDQLKALQDVKQQLETYIHTAALETTAKVSHGRSTGYNV